MRKDLNMRKGKMIAQGAHASIAFMTSRMQPKESLHLTPETKLITTFDASIRLSEAEYAWVSGRFTKICLGVNSEEELLAVHQAALSAGLVSHLITDAGLTEFNGVPTNTCICIGPDWEENIDPITKDLKLL